MYSSLRFSIKNVFRFTLNIMHEFHFDFPFCFHRAAQQAAALAASTNAGDRKGPPPLLRSRTLPSIIVPGIAILQNQIDSSRLGPGMLLLLIFLKFVSFYSTKL